MTSFSLTDDITEIKWPVRAKLMCGQPWKKVTRWNDVGRSFIREQQLVLDVSSFSGLAQGRESYSTVSGQRCLNGVFMSPGSVGGALANKSRRHQSDARCDWLWFHRLFTACWQKLVFLWLLWGRSWCTEKLQLLCEHQDESLPLKKSDFRIRFRNKRGWTVRFVLSLRRL